MEIAGSIPFHVAQAYGVRVTPPAACLAGPLEASAAPTISQLLPTAAPTEIERSAALSRIVAATVNRPMEFDGSATVSPHATLQLYTRAADKVEAAVAVNLGRAIDLTA